MLPGRPPRLLSCARFITGIITIRCMCGVHLVRGVHSFRRVIKEEFLVTVHLCTGSSIHLHTVPLLVAATFFAATIIDRMNVFITAAALLVGRICEKVILLEFLRKPVPSSALWSIFVVRLLHASLM